MRCYIIGKNYIKILDKVIKSIITTNYFNWKIKGKPTSSVRDCQAKNRLEEYPDELVDVAKPDFHLISRTKRPK